MLKTFIFIRGHSKAKRVRNLIFLGARKRLYILSLFPRPHLHCAGKPILLMGMLANGPEESVKKFVLYT